MRSFPLFSIPCAVLALAAATARADARSDLDAALAAIERGEHDAAVKAASRVAEGDALYGDALFCVAYSHAQKRDHEKAAETYRALLKLRPDDGRAWNNLGVALDDLGRYDEAIEAYETAIKADPSWAPAWNNKGVALDKKGDGQKAATMFREAIKLDEKYAAARNNLGAHLYETGDKPGAEREWREAAAIDPRYVSPIVNVSILDFEGDKASVGEARLQNLVNQGRGTADVYFNLGVMAFRRGDRPTALNALEKADEMRPSDPETLNNLGVLYSLKENYRRAEHVLRTSVEKRPEFAKAWDNLGLVLYRTHRFTEACEAFEKEIALTPESATAHYNRGCALAADKKEDEAMTAFRRAAEIDPAHVEAIHNLAILHGEKKDRNPAVERDLLVKAVTTDPTYAQGHLSLGRFYQTEPKYRDLAKALEHYREFLRLEPKDAPGTEEVARTITAIEAARGPVEK